MQGASSSSPAAAAPRVGCLMSPSLLLAPQYRKKNYSKQLPKEMYLRSDLACHTLLCGRPGCLALGSTVAALGGSASRTGVLDPSASDHYVVPSFLALQRFLAIFARTPSIYVILLRTHAAQAGAALTRQMREMLEDGASTRRVILFENESHAETATVQRGTSSSGGSGSSAEKESNEQRNARAIRRAARWFARHINGSSGGSGVPAKKRIILIEEDEGPTEESVRREQQEAGASANTTAVPSVVVYPRETGGITIHSMATYLQWLKDRATSSSASAPSSSPSSKAALTSAASLSPSSAEASALLDLYASLLDAEKNKIRQKLKTHAANLELQAMLASCKIELTRGLSERSVAAMLEPPSSASIDQASSSDLPPLPSPSPSPSSALTVAPAAAAVHSSDMEFEEHLPLEVALEAVRRGLLFRGHLRVNKYHAQLDAACDLGGRLIDASSGAMVESSSATSGVSVQLEDRKQKLGDIFIAGMADRNRAIDGDEIVVQMLPQNLWRAPTQRKKLAVKSATPSAAGGGAEEEETDAATAADDSLKPVPTGRVVSLIQRNRRPYVCTLQLDDRAGGGGSGGDYSLVVPMNECIPKIRIRTHQAAALANQRLLVQIDDDGWPADSKYPSGIYLHSLGPIGSVETGVKCILHELQISHPPWSINQMRCLPPRDIDQQEARKPKYKVGSGHHCRGLPPNPFAWTVPPEALQGRLDLRQSHRHAVCSIDPIGCEDIDDALSVLDLPNGNVQVGVHIADVSWYVAAGSVLDQEAARRGTSVYLVDRRLDMLPSVLSADLCSLRGGCDRLALSVLWEIEPASGKVLSTWYGRTCIYNSFALSYEEAQYIVDTEGGVRPPPELPPTHPDFHLTLQERYDDAPRSSLTPTERRELYPKILRLVKLGRMLREARSAAGALELDSLDIKFRLDPSTKAVVGVQSEADLEVHSTIAEWMVFANSTVAHAIWSRFPSAALLRHHPFPAPQRFERMLEMAHNLDLEIDITSNKTLAASLRKAEETLQKRACLTASPAATKLLQSAASGSGSSSSSSSDVHALDSQQNRHWMMRVLKELAARAMSEAQYFSTGSVAHQRDFFHYGLSANFYTHFTSPIRRYSDMIVHRQLLQVIELERQEFHAAKAEQKALKSSRGGVSSTAASAMMSPSLSFSGALSTELLGPKILLGNAALQELARHLNAKNRNAKIAGMESQDLFLACYLAGEKPEGPSSEEQGVVDEGQQQQALVTATTSVPRPLSSSPRPPPRVERCEGLIVSLRPNGFIVLIPAYHVKGALLLVDRDSRAVLAHPLALAFPSSTSSSADAAVAAAAPQANVTLDEVAQTLTLNLRSELPIPAAASSAAVSSSPPLPLSHTFRVFEPVLVDVTLRPNQSRYRTPKPIFTLVWQPAEPAETPALTRNNNAKQQQQAKSKTAPSPSSSSSSAAAAAAADAALDSATAALALLSSGPSAPAGAKVLKKSVAPSNGLLASSPLYLLLRDAATSSRHSKAFVSAGAPDDFSDDEQEEEERRIYQEAQRGAAAKLAAERKSRATPRIRHRFTGALGGRVLHTPSGVVPPELMKARILQQQAGRRVGEEEEEEEE